MCVHVDMHSCMRKLEVDVEYFSQLFSTSWVKIYYRTLFLLVYLASLLIDLLPLSSKCLYYRLVATSSQLLYGLLGSKLQFSCFLNRCYICCTIFLALNCFFKGCSWFSIWIDWNSWQDNLGHECPQSPTSGRKSKGQWIKTWLLLIGPGHWESIVLLHCLM